MNFSSDFLTAATVDYTPNAVATLSSVGRYCTASSLHFFAVDATAEAILDLRIILAKVDPGIHVFGPEDLGPERDVFLKAFRYYNAIEISCLAKYIGTAHILRNPAAQDICVYADSDTLFLGDINNILGDIRKRAVLLTSHQLSPSNGAIEHDQLLHGWINAGFFVVQRSHPDCWRVLDWLISRISCRGFLAPEYGMSCDQTWLSALPILYQDATSISRHPGLNVAYWNLGERQLADSGKVILVNGVPLLFFHFSGFEPFSGARLSRHSDLRVPSGSVLEKVGRLYQSELIASSWLKAEVAGLRTFQCSKSNLRERINMGEAINGISIVSPTSDPGFFLMLGRKADYLLNTIRRLLLRL